MDQREAFGQQYCRWIDRLELPAEQAAQAWRQISAQLFGTPSPEEGKRGEEQNGSKELSD